MLFATPIDSPPPDFPGTKGGGDSGVESAAVLQQIIISYQTGGLDYKSQYPNGNMILLSFMSNKVGLLLGIN